MLSEDIREMTLAAADQQYLLESMRIQKKLLRQKMDEMQAMDEAAMGEMISRATNTQSGCFRLLDRTLNNVLRILKQKGETRITMKIVSEASNMMML